jgi:hypothetical protein
MVHYGSYPDLDERFQEGMPLEDTIAGEVIITRQSYLVPDISKEEKCKYKDWAAKLGIHSMLAVPIYLQRFSKDLDTEGVLQIFYRDEDKVFTPLEVEIAEMFSKRVGYVIARKRIGKLQKSHMIKDTIVEHIFMKLARREGVKMKDLFNATIPELADIMTIRRCSLFCVRDDRKAAVLEAGFPEIEHGIGTTITPKEPYFDTVVNKKRPLVLLESDEINPTYVHIRNPKESSLLPSHLKKLLESREIHSVLYLPLRLDENVKYFLVFDAQGEYKGFTEDQIDLLTFFGKELTKGLRLENVQDILHDFFNSAIATAGFAKQVKTILEQGEYFAKKDKCDHALKIILEESLRIQELALTLRGEGREVEVDLSEKLRKRFLINKAAMSELRRSSIRFFEGDLASSLWIHCCPLHIERILDNLLSNAANAIPEQDGELIIRSYRREGRAVAEITNTGRIKGEDKSRLLMGEGKGRGLHIVTRLVKQMGGTIEVDSGDYQTSFRVVIPLIEPKGVKDG